MRCTDWFVLSTLLVGCSPPAGELPLDPDTGTPVAESGPGASIDVFLVK